MPEATGLEIAMLRVPGGEVDVELIEYQGFEPRSGSSPPSHYGTGHFCVFVGEIEALLRRARANGVAFRSDGPVEMTAGANRAARASTRSTPTGTSSSSTNGRPMSLPEAPSSRRPPDRRPLVEQYRLMALIRRFEERAAELFQQGVIFGTAHSCVGQEAIAVGAAARCATTDYLVGHHRSHGHLIAAGADLRRMMAEMFGKRTGYCKGLGGSMHIADLSLDILGCNGIVGAGIPHACGAALTASCAARARRRSPSSATAPPGRAPSTRG